MSKIARQHAVGVLVASTAPEAIAAAIRELTPSRIDAYKKNALQAAHVLCWEKESEKMLAAYGPVLG
jgi:hypothetical protein